MSVKVFTVHSEQGLMYELVTLGDHEQEIERVRKAYATGSYAEGYAAALIEVHKWVMRLRRTTEINGEIWIDRSDVEATIEILRLEASPTN